MAQNCKYDSLTNSIDITHLEIYVGQTIYVPDGHLFKKYGYDHFMKNLKGDIYHQTIFDKSKYESLSKRYFKIIGTGTPYGKTYKYIELKDTTKNEHLYYIVKSDNENEVNPELIFTGYLARMGKILIGKDVYLDTEKPHKIHRFYFNENNGEFSIDFGGIKDYPYSDNLLLQSKQNELLFNENNERNKNIEIYGDLKIGMKKDIVLKICGTPNNVNKTIDKSGVHEQLVYTNKYVYIDNEIVTSIQYMN
jgi:hypothetical protein